MRLLVLGGSIFLGRHVAEAALVRGWAVTTVSRGLHGTVPVGAEHVAADRADLSVLRGRSWDAVVDTSGRDPAHVQGSAGLDARHYVFTSSCSVYPAWPHEPVHEGSPVHADGDDYGARKAMCERVLEATRAGAWCSVRAGVIVGPGDDVLRLPWWLERLARGGRVLAPGAPEDPVQLIDVRDLAAFLLDLAERRATGTCNATSPPRTWGELLTTGMEVTGSGAELAWVSAERLLAAGVVPWDELPLWGGDWHGTHRIGTDRAHHLGLRHRPLREVLAGTWAWLEAGGREEVGDYGAALRPKGLPPEREAELLRGR